MVEIAIQALLLVAVGLAPSVLGVGLSIESLLLAPLVGALLATVAGLIAVLVGAPLLPCFVVVALAANGVAMWRLATTPEQGTGGQSRFPTEGLVVAAAALYPLLLLRVPDVYGDGRYIWVLHARWFFAGGSYVQDALANDAFEFTHADYPPLIPAAVGAVWRSAQGMDVVVAQAVITMLNVAAVGLFGLAIVRMAAGRLRVTATLVSVAACMAAYSFAGAYALNTYADLLWAAAASAATVWLLLLPKSREHLVIGLVCVAVAGLTKNEGLLIALLVLALTGVRWRDQLRAVAPLAGAVIAALVMWPILARVHGARSDLLGGPTAGGPLAVASDDWQRFIDTLRAARSMLGGLVVAAALCTGAGLVAAGRRRRELGIGSSAYSWAVVLGSLVALVGAYVVSPYDLAWHLGTSIFRTSIVTRMLLIAEVACWLLCAAAALVGLDDAVPADDDPAAVEPVEP